MERKTIAQIKNEFDLACEDMIEMIQNYQESLEDVEITNGIKNIDNFTWKLELENLYTPELKQFLEYYMRYEND